MHEKYTDDADTRTVYLYICSVFYDSVAIFCSAERETLSVEQSNFLELLIERSAKKLRNTACYGHWRTFYKKGILNEHENRVYSAIRSIVLAQGARVTDGTMRVVWQLAANLSVNVTNTNYINFMRGFLFGAGSNWPCVCQTGYPRESTMLLYNFYLNSITTEVDRNLLIETVLKCYQVEFKHADNNEFFTFFVGNLISVYPHITRLYMDIDLRTRICLLYFVADYIKTETEPPATREGPPLPRVDVNLMVLIRTQFVAKSSSVLQLQNKFRNELEPKEVIALIDVLVQASSYDQYRADLADYTPVLDNVCSMLVTIVKLGKSLDDGNGDDTSNDDSQGTSGTSGTSGTTTSSGTTVSSGGIYGFENLSDSTQSSAPSAEPDPDGEDSNPYANIEELDKMIPNSGTPSQFENKVTYRLKSMLIRLIGNMAYRNRAVQLRVSETEAIQAILDSTTLDARNPCKYIVSLRAVGRSWIISNCEFILFSICIVTTVMKEWSILALRNLTENCEENKRIIGQMVMLGNVKNKNIVQDLKYGSGSVRIRPKKPEQP